MELRTARSKAIALAVTALAVALVPTSSAGSPQSSRTSEALAPVAPGAGYRTTTSTFDFNDPNRPFQRADGPDVGNHCDDCTTLISFPFPVDFYGQTYTSARVSSNGNVQFTGNSSSPDNGCLPNANFDAVFMGLQGDLRTNGTGDGIFVDTFGTAPNRVFNILWRMHYFVSSNHTGMSMWFYENDPRIEVAYFAAPDAGHDSGVSEVVGVQASPTGPATQFSCRTASVPPLTLVSFIPTRVLTLAMTGSGSGRVTSSPAGIDCGVTCTATVDQGSDVTLVAQPAEGDVFGGWSGGGCSGVGPCTVTMESSKDVTATFLISKTLSVNKTGTGDGTVTSTPTGINCGTICAAAFDNGISVELNAFPAPGSVFAGWSVECTGTGACSVSMTQDRTVTATFEAEEEPPGPKCPGFENDPRNQVIGSGAAETLTGTPGNDIICGLGANDELRGVGGRDLLIGGGGKDVAKGGPGNDILSGGRGNDRLLGALGRDRAIGGAGRDTCRAERRQSCES
jgi:Ca2+-binding RTX toxin-like protein